jgi:hypothetical protein
MQFRMETGRSRPFCRIDDFPGGDHFQEAGKRDLGRAVGCRVAGGAVPAERVHHVGLERQVALGSGFLALGYTSDGHVEGELDPVAGRQPDAVVQLGVGVSPVQIASFIEGAVHGSVFWTTVSVRRLAIWLAPQWLLVRAARVATHGDAARSDEASSPAVCRRFLDRAICRKEFYLEVLVARLGR